MRVLLKATIPVEKGNEAIRSGEFARTIESLTEALKPEAAYFLPQWGNRAALFVFDMDDFAQLPPIVEPLFDALNARISITPVMNADDLQRGLKAVGA